jgi:hypothetical protein
MSTSPDAVSGTSPIATLWTRLFGLVLWFGASYGQFLDFDLEIAANAQNAQRVAGLGALVSAVALALTLNAPNMFKIASRRRFWYFGTIALVIAFAVFFFLYRDLHFIWTCRSDAGISLLKGADPTPWMQAYLAKGGAACAAFEQFPGNTAALYDEASVWRRYQVLSAIYIVTWAILASLIVSVANCFRIRSGLAVKR